MKRKIWRISVGILIASVVLVAGLIGLWISATGYPVFDPSPKGEGSYEELYSVFKQFRTYYHTRSANDLPPQYVHLSGYDSDELNAKKTWMIYYASASHSFRRGGTIVLMGSDGRIDGYFGHQCSKRNGVSVMVVPKEPSYWSGGTYYNGLEGVRQAFDSMFKHQQTEQISGGNGR